MPDPSAHRTTPGALPTHLRGVVRHGRWAVGPRPDGTEFAVSRRCRHQLGDLSGGHVDAEGCLVCPWHGARYNTADGRMVAGPRGFFGYHGPTPGYTELVRGVGAVVRLAVGRVVRRGGDVTVERVSSPFAPRTWGARR